MRIILVLHQNETSDKRIGVTRGTGRHRFRFCSEHVFDEDGAIGKSACLAECIDVAGLCIDDMQLFCTGPRVVGKDRIGAQQDPLTAIVNIRNVERFAVASAVLLAVCDRAPMIIVVVTLSATTVPNRSLSPCIFGFLVAIHFGRSILLDRIETDCCCAPITS